MGANGVISPERTRSGSSGKHKRGNGAIGIEGNCAARLARAACVGGLSRPNSRQLEETEAYIDSLWCGEGGDNS
jgi:hypothetical protein